MTVCHVTRPKVKVTRPSVLEIQSISKSVSSAVYNLSWQVTSDS